MLIAIQYCNINNFKNYFLENSLNYIILNFNLAFYNI